MVIRLIGVVILASRPLARHWRYLNTSLHAAAYQHKHLRCWSPSSPRETRHPRQALAPAGICAYPRIVGTTRKGTAPRRRSGAAERCKNLYRFIRLRLGEAPSDREVARRWAMEWKSFVALKQGKRQVPRVEELEALARLLNVDPAFVFQVAGGVSAREIAALATRESRLRALLEHVPEAIFTIDPRGRVQDVNRRFCELAGRSAQELIELPFFDLVTPESAPRLAGALAMATRDGEARGAEVAVRATHGPERIVQLDLKRIMDAAGIAIGIQGVARDVTEERRLLREFDDQRRLLQMIYECVPAAYVLFDRDGTILAANPLVERVCATTAAEMIGRNAFDVFGNPGPARCPVTRAFLTGQVEQQVSWLKNRADQKIYVHRTAGPIVKDGRVDKVIEMMVDVTGQIQGGDLRVLALWQGQSELAADPHSERRASPRAPTAFVVRYAARERRASATAVSLAAGGLFLETAGDSAAVGEEIELEWSLPGDDVPVRARGIVVWRRLTSADGPGGLGIRFVSVVPAFAPITQRRKRPS